MGDEKVTEGTHERIARLSGEAQDALNMMREERMAKSGGLRTENVLAAHAQPFVNVTVTSVDRLTQAAREYKAAKIGAQRLEELVIVARGKLIAAALEEKVTRGLQEAAARLQDSRVGGARDQQAVDALLAEALK